MGRRVGAWLLALVVVAGLGVGAVVGASSRGSRGARHAVSKDLADLGDEARAWRLAPKVTKGRVAELAGALGFKAKPTATEGGWRVFEGGKLLQISREFGAPWTYVANLTVNCAGIGRGGPDAAVSSDGVVDCPVP